MNFIPTTYQVPEQINFRNAEFYWNGYGGFIQKFKPHLLQSLPVSLRRDPDSILKPTNSYSRLTAYIKLIPNLTYVTAWSEIQKVLIRQNIN